MPKSSHTTRLTSLLVLLTAFFLVAGADLGVAAASAKNRRVGHHHVSRVGHHHVSRVSWRNSWAWSHVWPEPKEHPAKKRATTKKAATDTAAPITAAPTATTAQAPTPPEPIGIPGNWNLTLDSEFNGPSLDTSIWHTGWFGSGVTDPTNSYEEDCYSPSNVTFPGDGTMHLNVTATPSTCGGETRPYTGSLVSTNPDDGAGGGFQFTYGVVEARVYLPADGNQIANWPAVWTDGQVWPQDGEDDLLEGLGGQACYHFHDPLGGPGNCDTSITPGWHTFASDWQPGSVTYYYDGVDVGSITTGITSSPMYLILNNTVSPYSPNDSEADSMQVQYVRVWQS